MVFHFSLTWRHLIRTEAQGESRGWAGPGLVIAPFYRRTHPPAFQDSQNATDPPEPNAHAGPGEQGGVNITPQAQRPQCAAPAEKTAEPGPGYFQFHPELKGRLALLRRL